MRIYVALLAVSFALGLSGVALAQTAMTPTIETPSQVQWKPGTGPNAGTEVAVMAGDPTQAGAEYTIRLRLPDGAKFPPHFHSGIENVTVLEGTLMVGLGDTMDQSKMMALPAGSFASVPKDLHHYAMARGVTVIQISGIGPETMTAAGH